jgi:hypothetical protein
VDITWEKGCFPILRLRKWHILGGSNYLLKHMTLLSGTTRVRNKFLIYNEEVIIVLSFVVMLFVG